MARGSGLALFLAAVAFGYGGGHLALTLSDHPERAAAGGGLAEVLEAASQSAVEPETPAGWPALFGTRPPAQTVAPEPARPKVKYSLVGLVAGTRHRWAIVNSTDGDALVNIGDTLQGGETVLEIDGQGVWIDRDGTRELIAFRETAKEAMTRMAFAAPEGGDDDAPLSAKIPIDAFRGRDMRRVLGRAGSVRMVRTAGENGVLVPEILWVREGQLYDRIGLRKGDTVLRVNGFPAGAPETLANAREILGSTDEFEVEIMRGGVKRTISVVITGRG